MLHIDVQRFINEKINTDTLSVLLKKPFFNQISNQELAVQIEAKKKSKKKLPTWFKNAKIYYPKRISIEQSSSEITARYKAELVDGKSLIDLTGGFGVDSYFFSKKIAEVFHCEIDKNLSEIVRHNFDVLDAQNIHTSCVDGINYLKVSNRHFDWIYVDPSRRNDAKGKVFKLSDCLPDVTAHLDLLFDHSDNILIKTSPLLDIKKGLTELEHVQKLLVVAINNEVKELLWVLKRDYKGEIGVNTINIQNKTEQVFNFELSQEKQVISKFSAPLTYLYEPNAALMKSGGFKTIGAHFKLKKLHPNTHLYTSSTPLNFPGRCFKIDATLPYQTKLLKKLGLKKANITTRNFPENVVAIRKKTKITDGGDVYLFFTTDLTEKRQIIQCSKIP